jgi:hypothetical protein
MHSQEEYFQQHKKEILGTNARFAMVSSNKIEYFNDEKSLYKTYPHLAPETGCVFGTFPMFVDIGKETNSIGYRTEQLEEREKRFDKALEKLVIAYNKIREERKKLKNI